MVKVLFYHKLLMFGIFAFLTKNLNINGLDGLHNQYLLYSRLMKLSVPSC